MIPSFEAFSTPPIFLKLLVESYTAINTAVHSLVFDVQSVQNGIYCRLPRAEIEESNNFGSRHVSG